LLVILIAASRVRFNPGFESTCAAFTRGGFVVEAADESTCFADEL
jgi:hypothetical protein